MRQAALLLAVLLGAAPAQAATCAPALRVMTYNIRLDTPADGENRWERRRPLLLSQIDLLQPGLIGLQEVVPGQLADLAAALPGYSRIGQGRDEGGRGEASPLFVSRALFAAGQSGMFWLSPTPERPSLGWDAAYRRVATWAHLRRRADGARVLAIATHWDHQGVQARLEGGKLLASWIAAHRAKGEAVVVLGDFNAPLGEPSVQALLGPLVDARGAAGDKAAGTTITFNGYDPLPKTGQSIDHVLVSAGTRVLRYHALAEQFDGRLASDHFPVIADLALGRLTPCG